MKLWAYRDKDEWGGVSEPAIEIWIVESEEKPKKDKNTGQFFGGVYVAQLPLDQFKKAFNGPMIRKGQCIQIEPLKINQA